MHLRTPRTKVKDETYLREAIKLCHPRMILVVACILTVGHLLSPSPFSVERYVLGVAGVLLSLLGAYRINELADHTTTKRTPASHHKIFAVIFYALALIIALYLSYIYVYWIVILALIGAVLMISYNWVHWPIIHNRVVYGFIWAFLPLLFSEMLQSLDLNPPRYVYPFASWAMIVAVFTLWLWGPTTCGRVETCSKIRGQYDLCKAIASGHCGYEFCVAEAWVIRCHSPVIRCYDRLRMPAEIDVHMKVLILYNDIAILTMTIGLAAWRFIV